MTSEIIEFEYRRMFGLSHKEMMAEPFDVFILNSFIMNKKLQIENEEYKKQLRKQNG